MKYPLDWLTELYLYGSVNLTLDMRNARPAFPQEREEPNV